MLLIEATGFNVNFKCSFTHFEESAISSFLQAVDLSLLANNRQ